MTPLAAKLQQVLRGATRLAVLAVGSRLRGDDAVGLLAGENIEKLARDGQVNSVVTGVFYGETAPENLTGEIRKFQPSHLLLIDAADMGLQPGMAELIDMEDASGGASFSTHRMPVTVLLDYLRSQTGCRSAILGIQPISREFSLEVSEVAQRAADEVAAAVIAGCSGSTSPA